MRKRESKNARMSQKENQGELEGEPERARRTKRARAIQREPDRVLERESQRESQSKPTTQKCCLHTVSQKKEKISSR